MLKNKLSPSMMCADPMKLSDTLDDFQKCGVEYLHIDVMDGEFVPNFTLGTDYCRILKKNTDIPLDIHLMINDPENKLSWFDFGEGDYVSVHVESTKHLQRALSMIKNRGAKPMVAINPATPIETLEFVLDDICAVLVMTVNPGFAGQKMIPATLDKIRKLREYLDERGYVDVEIEVDGNVSFENAVLMKQAGANIFVGGTSSIFSADGNICENIDRMRKSLE